MRSATSIGTVQNVRGSTVSVVLSDDNASGLSFVDGYGYRIGQVGSFVRVPLGYVSLFGVVSQVGAGAVPEGLRDDHPYGNRWMTIQLVGEGEKRSRFRRGISQYPIVGDEVHLVTESDLRAIYGRVQSAEYLQLGWVASAESIPALVDINKLVSRHSAVVGATGSGKSTTVAALLGKLSDPDRYPSARVLLVDMHGEYAASMPDRALVLKTTPTSEEHPLQIPYWALTFDELVPLTFGDLAEPARTVVMDLITEMKQEAVEAGSFAGVSVETVSADTPIPFSIHRLWFELYRREFETLIQEGGKPKGDWKPAFEVAPDGHPSVGDALSVVAPRYRSVKNAKDDPEKIQYADGALGIRRQVRGLAAKLRDPRLSFLFRPGKWLPSLDGQAEADLDELLRSWLGNDRPVTILDLSGIPVSIVNQIVGSLLRVLYDAIFWAKNIAEGGRERPLLLVLEEAHAYLNAELAPAASDAVRRIAKEGRKYGIGAMIVSQRPAEIDQTILSQCGTIIAMRLGNEADRRHVSSAAADNLDGLFSMLPVLRVGEAIVVGEAVNLPVRAIVQRPEESRLPDSRDPRAIVRESASGEFHGPGGWNQPRGPEDYREVLERWRRQDSALKDR